MSDLRDVNVTKKVKESVVPFAVLFFFFAFLMWLIIKPLGRPLMWSVVLSYLAYPIYRYIYEKLFSRKWSNLAAAITTIVILFFMVIPMVFFAIFLANESAKIYEAIAASGVFHGSYDGIIAWLNNIPFISDHFGNVGKLSGLPVFGSVASSAIGLTTSAIKMFSKQVVGNAFKIFYLFAVVTISSFFMVRDGHFILAYMRDILPLSGELRDAIIQRGARMLRAVVFGIILTAAIQGCLGALGWWFAGLPNPIFFGFMMFLTGMIPFVGTPIIWIPGSIALLITGKYLGGALLFAWGLCVVSTIDNFIRPIFISEGSNIHMLVIFIGIFGGLYNWGFLGIFVGPLALSLGIFMLDIYKAVVSDALPIEDGPADRPAKDAEN